MPRRVLGTLASVALLLCAAAVVLWVRSYRVSDYLTNSRYAFTGNRVETRQRTVLVGAGNVAFVAESATLRGRFAEPDPNPRQRGWRWDTEGTQPPGSILLLGRAPSPWNRAGFGRFSASRGRAGEFEERFRAVMVPLWLPAAVFGVLPAVRLGRRVKAVLRARAGRCTRCGYDLTGNTSGVCPECGGATAAHRSTFVPGAGGPAGEGAGAGAGDPAGRNGITHA